MQHVRRITIASADAMVIRRTCCIFRLRCLLRFEPVKFCF